jgi:hypothetical protein
MPTQPIDEHRLSASLLPVVRTATPLGAEIMRFALLAIALLITAPAFAQSDVPPYGLETPNPIKGSQLGSPSTPNPEFPLRVWLRIRHNTWDGSYEYYSGDGKFQFATANPAKPGNFEYQCGVTFLNPAVNQFQARWIKPDKTLQIVLADPNRPRKVRTCNLTVLARPLPHVRGFVH